MDTHTRTHAYAVLTAAGQHVGIETFPNTAAGQSRAINWAGRRSGGVTDALWVIAGAGSYGAQLARNVADTGHRSAAIRLAYPLCQTNVISDVDTSQWASLLSYGDISAKPLDLLAFRA